MQTAPKGPQRGTCFIFQNASYPTHTRCKAHDVAEAESIPLVHETYAEPLKQRAKAIGAWLARGAVNPLESNRFRAPIQIGSAHRQQALAQHRKSFCSQRNET